MKSFTDDRKTKSILLGADYKHEPTPPGMKLNLGSHQQTVLAAMLDLENKRCVKISTERTYTSSAGILSEKMGSGKTIMIISLILAKKLANPSPIFFSNRGSSSVHLITKRFSKKNILKSNLLFVSKSVVKQWKSEIEKHSNLKVFCAVASKDFTKLNQIIQDSSVSKYDIVLVKLGKTVCSYGKVNSVSNPIINLVSEMSLYKCWSRIIIDDYDVVKLPRVIGSLNAHMMWCVSTTSVSSKNHYDTYAEFTEPHEIIAHRNLVFRNSERGMDLLSSVFNVKNDSEYTENSISLSRPNQWLYKIRNPNKKIINIIGHLMNSSDIKEMLHAGAVKTVAEHIGIKANSIDEIYKVLLKEEYSKYNKSKDVLEWINKLDIKSLTPLKEIKCPESYGKKDAYDMKPILYKHAGISRLIEEVKGECTYVFTTTGRTINMIKSSLDNKNCDICFDMFAGGLFIFPCCYKNVCDSCWEHIRKGGRHNSLAVNIKCPYCRVISNISGFAYIDHKDREVKKTEEADESDSKEETKITIVDPYEMKKIDCIVKIIQGYELKKTSTPLDAEGVLCGINEQKETPQEKRKILIFSNHREQLLNIAKKLNELKIGHKIMHGSSSATHSIKEEYGDPSSDLKILLVSAAKYSAGCNLQITSDLIFGHKIIEKGIRSQVVGRAQRPPRKYKLNIHQVYYEDEV